MAHLKLTHYDEIPVLQLFAIVLISVSSWIQYFYIWPITTMKV